MFTKFAMPILKSIIEVPSQVERRSYSIAGMGESLVEKAIGEKVLTIPGIELGYCARPGEVEVRVIGDRKAIQAADVIIRGELGLSVFSDNDEPGRAGADRTAHAHRHRRVLLRFPPEGFKDWDDVTRAAPLRGAA
jgi:hypothetical protein